MKRVRGVDEIAPPAAATLKNTGGGGAVVGSGGAGIEYHTGPGIGVVSGQAVRSVPSKEMPGSIQFSQAQQQYPGAIVVPTAAPSPVKVCSYIKHIQVNFFFVCCKCFKCPLSIVLQGGATVGGLSTSSTCAASSITSSVTLHTTGIGGTGNHNMGPQTAVPSSQAQPHTQTPSAIRHNVITC